MAVLGTLVLGVCSLSMWNLPFASSKGFSMVLSVVLYDRRDNTNECVQQ